MIWEIEDERVQQLVNAASDKMQDEIHSIQNSSDPAKAIYRLGWMLIYASLLIVQVLGMILVELRKRP